MDVDENASENASSSQYYKPGDFVEDAGPRLRPALIPGVEIDINYVATMMANMSTTGDQSFQDLTANLAQEMTDLTAKATTLAQQKNKHKQLLMLRQILQILYN